MAMYNKIQILLDRNRITEADEEISKFIARYPDNSNVDELKKIKSSLENKLSASKE
jgi:outer membrane protein assembly factor BamD (BamD/ComL family)